MQKTGWILLALGVLAIARFGVWHRRRDHAMVLCGEMEGGVSEFRGSLQRMPNGFWELSEPRWSRGIHRASQSFYGEVWLTPQSGTSLAQMDFGQEIAVSGPFHCVDRRRNPARVEDVWETWRLPRVYLSGRQVRIRVVSGAPSTWVSRFQLAFDAGLGRLFAGFPGCLGLERAVWLGDTTGLPPRLTVYYREGGLLHFLSLSGQRVYALVWMGSLGLRFLLAVTLALGGWKFGGRLFREIHRALPLFCCGMLFFTSHGTGALTRTGILLSAHLVLRARRLHVSVAQRVSSSIACLLLVEPQLLGNAGFLLSAAMTSVLCFSAFPSPGCRAWVRYFILNTAMPVMAMPFSAERFAVPPTFKSAIRPSSVSELPSDFTLTTES